MTIIDSLLCLQIFSPAKDGDSRRLGLREFSGWILHWCEIKCEKSLQLEGTPVTVLLKLVKHEA